MPVLNSDEINALIDMFCRFSPYIVKLYDMRVDKTMKIDCLLRNFLAQRRLMIPLDIFSDE